MFLMIYDCWEGPAQSSFILNFCMAQFLPCTTEYQYLIEWWWWLTEIMHKSTEYNVKNINVEWLWTKLNS